MNFDDYQDEAAATAVYANAFYPRVSLMVEAAELVDLFVKPELRGDDKEVKRQEVVSEAGDVLWNLANMLKDLDISFQEVADYSIQKVLDRQQRGVIMGDGGER